MFSAVLWVTRKWWHWFPPSCHFTVTPQMAFRWIWALQKLNKQEPTDSRSPQAHAPSGAARGLSWTDDTLSLDLYLQSISSGLGKHVLPATGVFLIQLWMRKQLAGDPQGALRLSPANIFIKANVSSPLGTWRLLSTYHLSKSFSMWRMSSKGQHPSISESTTLPSSEAPTTPPAALL